MNKIRLYGALRREFGAEHEFEVKDAAEVFQALFANFPDFLNAIRNGHYRVVVGKTARDGLEMDEAMLPGFNLGRQTLHIVPVTKGSKRGGVGKIIAGVALVGLTLATGGSALMATSLGGGATVGSTVGSFAAAMTINGVATFIAPEAKAENNEQSFTMTGPTTTTREGGIVPIIYGRVWTGGTMINGALSIRGDDQPVGNTPEEIFTGLSDS